MRKYFLLIFIFISVSNYAKDNLVFDDYLEIIEKKKENKYLAGDYKLYIDGKTYDMRIKVRCNKPKVVISLHDKKVSSKFSLKKNVISITINENDIYIQLVGKILNATGAMGGIAFDSNGKKSEWSAAKIVKESKSKNKSSTKKTN